MPILDMNEYHVNDSMNETHPIHAVNVDDGVLLDIVDDVPIFNVTSKILKALNMTGLFGKFRVGDESLAEVSRRYFQVGTLYMNTYILNDDVSRFALC